MLVEDNKIAKRMVEIYCADLGIDIHSFETVESAYQAYEKTNYDLIISDIGLPDRTGYEFAQLIRNLEHQQQRDCTPIIGLTAHAHAEVKKNCFNSGMQDVISKPISRTLLENIIATYCKVYPEAIIAGDSTRMVDAPETQKNLSYHFYESYPLLDVDEAMKRIQSQTTLREMLSMFLEQDLRPGFHAASIVFQQESYGVLLEWVHKIRGGAIYCSLVRLAKISQLLEELLIQHHAHKVRNLFPIWTYIVFHSQQTVEEWLNGRYYSQ